MQRIVYFIVFIIMVVGFMSGCQKDDNNLNNSIYRVKIYNDSLAGVNNPDTKIATGAGRLYMTYGQGGREAVPIGNTSFVGYSAGYSIQVMSTDNEGNLLWKNKLPVSELNTGGLIELNNGNCLVVAKGNDFLGDQIYLFIVDRNGQWISIDSSLFPISTSGGFFTISSINSLKTPNGNILVYGNFQDGNGWQGYAIEYSANMTVLWAKAFNYFPITPPFNYPGTFISSCTTTPDGGFLFLGSATPDPLIEYVNIILIKTSAVGNIIWTKSFDHANLDIGIGGGIIPLTNGLSRFYFNTVGTKSIMNIYDVNSVGDSVNAIAINEMVQNNGSIMLPDNNGGSFALMNTYAWLDSHVTPGGVFNNLNTMHLSFGSGLNINSKGKFQTQTTDFLTAACKTSDGKTACFGMIQCNGRGYYNPELIIID